MCLCSSNGNVSFIGRCSCLKEEMTAVTTEMCVCIEKKWSLFMCMCKCIVGQKEATGSGDNHIFRRQQDTFHETTLFVTDNLPHVFVLRFFT